MILEFATFHGDILKLPSDLLILKYAQARWGLDGHVAELLMAQGRIAAGSMEPDLMQSALVETHGLIAPGQALFVGTVPISSMGYEEIHQIGRNAMEAIGSKSLNVQHVTTTVHGVGFGLDAGESAQSLTLGFLEGLRTSASGPVRQITFADTDERTIRKIAIALEQMGIMTSQVNTPEMDHHPVFLAPREGRGLTRPPETLGQQPGSKDHVFVAMPFAQEFQDVYEFGIYAPIRRCGLICEKVDEVSFTGDILDRIRERIRSAKFVVADLTGARPNVYLEVGYAWGCGVPVVFLAKDSEPLHFDVKSHRCIYYKTIGQLSRDLAKLVQDLYAPDGHQVAHVDADRRSREHHSVRRVSIQQEEMLPTRRLADVSLISLPVTMSVEGGKALHHTVRHLLSQGARAIVFDLGNVRYCNSSGLGGIVAAASIIEDVRGSVKLASAPSGLDESFKITKLSRILAIYDTAEEAIASFHSGEAQ